MFLLPVQAQEHQRLCKLSEMVDGSFGGFQSTIDQVTRILPTAAVTGFHFVSTQISPDGTCFESQVRAESTLSLDFPLSSSWHDCIGEGACQVMLLPEVSPNCSNSLGNKAGAYYSSLTKRSALMTEGAQQSPVCFSCRDLLMLLDSEPCMHLLCNPGSG